MSAAPLPEDEPERLAELRSYAVLDTEAEQSFDDLTRIASRICETPVALVSLVDADRQWFKSRQGLDAAETPRDVAFCAHAILRREEVLVVNDSLQDERFRDNPLATGEPGVRFYAGAPLVTPTGRALGTLCVIDHEPRSLSEDGIEALRALSRQVVAQLELRRKNAQLLTATEELVRANESLRQFTSLAAHDLQEPMRKVRTFARALAEDLDEGDFDEARTSMGYITDAAERMQRMIAGLLALSRADSREMERETVSLSSCVGNTLRLLGLRIEETGASVTVDAPHVVAGDATLLLQVFQNLIGNALKFAEDTPSVHVSSRLADDEVVVSVRDHGIGIPPERTEEIFRPLRRLHASSVYEGSGIGLAVVARIVERHGGRIQVESTPGEGSCFSITLPAASRDAPCVPAPMPPNFHAKPGRTRG